MRLRQPEQAQEEGKGMTDSKQVDLSHYESLVVAEDNADTARRFHESEAKKYTRVRDEIREQLDLLMGDAEVGLVNGKDVLRRTKSKQFAWAKFRDELPDIYAEYKVVRLAEEVDTDRLAKELPDVYARFCSSRWTNNAGVL